MSEDAHNYVKEYPLLTPRAAVAFEDDYAFKPTRGIVIGEELTVSKVGTSRRLIFQPTEPILRHGTGEPCWQPTAKRYLPARKVRFTT